MINLPEFANPVLSEKEARRIFAPYYEKLIGCINGAWEQWEVCPQRHALDARTRASFISSLFRHLAKAAFNNDLDSNVSHSDSGNSFFLYIGIDAKARLKKLKPNGRYSNIMTGRQLMLMKQMNIPGILPGTYFTIGYQLDDLQQRIQRRKITLQSSKGIIYSIDLDDAVSAAPAAGVSVMPQTPPSSTGSRARARKEVASTRKKRYSGRE
jgi:hypothetical protein